jgi:hypothetical protein
MIAMKGTFVQHASSRAMVFAPAIALLITGPALAVTTSLPEIQTGATNVQNTVVFIGYIAAVIGLVFAALHYFSHRDDLFGTAYRVLGSLLAGYIITHVTAIMGWSGSATLIP